MCPGCDHRDRSKARETERGDVQNGLGEAEKPKAGDRDELDEVAGNVVSGDGPVSVDASQDLPVNGQGRDPDEVGEEAGQHGAAQPRDQAERDGRDQACEQEDTDDREVAAEHQAALAAARSHQGGSQAGRGIEKRDRSHVGKGQGEGDKAEAGRSQCTRGDDGKTEAEDPGQPRAADQEHRSPEQLRPTRPQARRREQLPSCHELPH